MPETQLGDGSRGIVVDARQVGARQLAERVQVDGRRLAQRRGQPGAVLDGPG